MNTLTFFMANAPVPPTEWIEYYQRLYTPPIEKPKMPTTNSDEIREIEIWEGDRTYDLPDKWANYQKDFSSYLDKKSEARWIGLVRAHARWNSLYARANVEEMVTTLDGLFEEAFPRERALKNGQ